MKVKNLNHVPKKAWKKWTAEAREVFNRVYDFGMTNQQMTKHPAATMLPAHHWKTVVWNLSWIAADAVDEVAPEYVTIAAPRVNEILESDTI